MKKSLLITIVLAAFLLTPPVFARNIKAETAGQNGLSTSQDSPAKIRETIENLKLERTEVQEQKKIQLLERVKTLAQKKLQNLIKRYTQIKTRVNKMTVISTERKAELSTKIDAEIAKIEAAKEKVTAATTAAEVKTVMDEIKAQTKNSVNLVKEVVAGIHATHLENIITKLNTILEKLTAKVTELTATDKTVYETLQADAKESLDAAKVKITAKDFKGAKTDILAARKSLVELSQKIKAASETNTEGGENE